jgi:hypothetical protein
MLRTWIQLYDEINASSKGSRKNRRNTTPKEPEMEEELHKSSLSESARLDVRLVLNGSTAMLKLSMGIGTVTYKIGFVHFARKIPEQTTSAIFGA